VVSRLPDADTDRWVGEDETVSVAAVNSQLSTVLTLNSSSVQRSQYDEDASQLYLLQSASLSPND